MRDELPIFPTWFTVIRKIALCSTIDRLVKPPPVPVFSNEGSVMFRSFFVDKVTEIRSDIRYCLPVPLGLTVQIMFLYLASLAQFLWKKIVSIVSQKHPPSRVIGLILKIVFGSLGANIFSTLNSSLSSGCVLHYFKHAIIQPL